MKARTAALNFMILLLVLTGTSPRPAEGDNTPPLTESCGLETLPEWRAVRAAPASVDANGLALNLADCLPSPHPELRDRIGYEVLTYWLRSDALGASTIDALSDKLRPWLTHGIHEAGQEHALGRAFSALIMSEIIRHDTSDRRWSREQLAAWTTLAISAFQQERDYRGLDPELGWIHTIAHQSDLLWRLVRHPGSIDTEHLAILQALTSQITRPDLPPYVFNEGDRLARVAQAVLARGLVESDAYLDWLEDVVQPRDLKTWNEAFASVSGMTQLHNTKQFLRALKQTTSPQSQISTRLDTLLAALP